MQLDSVVKIPIKIMNTNPRLNNAIEAIWDSPDFKGHAYIDFTHRSYEFQTKTLGAFVDCLIENKVRFATIIYPDRVSIIRRA